LQAAVAAVTVALLVVAVVRAASETLQLLLSTKA